MGMKSALDLKSEESRQRMTDLLNFEIMFQKQQDETSTLT